MLRVEVWKNFIAASDSSDGEFDTSTTTSAPARALESPSPVSVLTPVSGAAATASWPRSRSEATTFEPIRPVPPIITTFMTAPVAWKVDESRADFGHLPAAVRRRGRRTNEVEQVGVHAVLMRRGDAVRRARIIDLPRS